ncbi:MAG: hypothetical protein P1P74_05165 [Desulfuromonadales bacterium]|nr:hypothetical protein [Desulfuromonadales bacterium]
MNTRHLIFFGHRGAGTSSVAAHLAAAYAEAGRGTILIGCGDDQAPALVSRATVNHDSWTTGFKRLGCRLLRPSGNGWSEPVRLLGEELAARHPAAELVLIDAGADRTLLEALLSAGLASQILAVTDAEPASLRAINQLWRDLQEEPVEVGLIGNNLTEPYAGPIVEDFARKTGTGLQGYLPRALAVIRSAFLGETVIEAAPLAHATYLYRDLAKLLLNPGVFAAAEPLDDEEFRDWAAGWGDRLYDLGEGYVGFGGGI